MTPRERFVEAMRRLPNIVVTTTIQSIRREAIMREAVKAFADAECSGGGMDCAGPDSKFAATEHNVTCRAALLRECGLEE